MNRPLPLSHPVALLATWFGSGLLPRAPGTWGSLAALPFAWIIASIAGPIGLALAAAVVFGIGCWAAERYADATGKADPGAVVIDEVAGQWLVLVAAPLSLPAYATGFLLFRLLDIVKPWPASWVDRKLKGGVGIMADDVLAAGYGLVLMYLGRDWIGGI